MKNKKLSIVFGFSLFFAVLVGGIFTAPYVYIKFNDILTTRVVAHLQTASRAKADEVEMFIQWNKERAQDFSSDGLIKESLYKIKNGTDTVAVAKALTSHLIINKMPVWESLREILILDTKGVVISSTNEKTSVGLDLAGDPLFLNGKSAPYMSDLSHNEDFNEDLFSLSTPVIWDGEFVGVLAVKIPTNAFYNILTERTGMGETGESYVINKEGFLLSPSLFLQGENSGILTQIVRSDNAAKCLTDVKNFNSDNTFNHYNGDEPDVYLDYRGVRVVGAHHIIPKMNWCLLTEIDKSEIWNKERKNFMINYFLVLSLAALLVSMTGFAVCYYLSKKYRIWEN